MPGTLCCIHSITYSSVCSPRALPTSSLVAMFSRSLSMLRDLPCAISSGSNWQGSQEAKGVLVLVAGLASQLLIISVFLRILTAFVRRGFRKESFRGVE